MVAFLLFLILLVLLWAFAQVLFVWLVAVAAWLFGVSLYLGLLGGGLLLLYAFPKEVLVAIICVLGGGVLVYAFWSAWGDLKSYKAKKELK